jgi:hypothetical protein
MAQKVAALPVAVDQLPRQSGAAADVKSSSPLDRIRDTSELPLNVVPRA